MRERLERLTAALPERWAPGVVFLLACVLIFLRKPDALLNPQFSYEDGPVFYAEAHDLGGFHALALGYRGYFVLVQRLGGLLSLAFPLARAPLVFGLVAIAVEALPAAFLASSRLSSVVPRREVRLLLALLYVALPGTWGIIANLTNAQWHLAVLACLVVLAASPPTRAWRTLDVAVLALSGLSGPLCLALLPVAGVVLLVRRTRWSAVALGVTAVAAATQVVSLLTRAEPVATHAALGASFGAFLRLLAQRVVYAALLGQRASAYLLADGGALGTKAAVAVAGLACIALVVYACVRAPLELKLFLAFGATVLAFALVWPVPVNYVDEHGYWGTLFWPGAHVRYFYVLTLGLVASFVWLLLGRTTVPERAVGALGLACVVLCAAPLDWREPAYRDFRFSEYVAKYDRAAPGDRVQIPIPPDWSMILTKEGQPGR